jgi:hypothetical protein
MSDEDIAYYRGILNNTDDFYQAKYDEHGDVRSGWSNAKWTLDRVADIRRFGTRNCHTALRA